MDDAKTVSPLLQWTADPAHPDMIWATPPDPVKRPAHYRIFDELAGRDHIEALDVIECIVKHYPPEIAYFVGNELKYLIRAPHKGNMQQDLEKVEQYNRRAVNRLAKAPR